MRSVAAIHTFNLLNPEIHLKYFKIQVLPNINQLMLSKEIISVQKIIQIRNRLHGQNVGFFNIIVGCPFSNQCALKGKI
jgi:hypothetical protein